MIQGLYGIKPQLPAVGGNEGVAEVIAVIFTIITCINDVLDWYKSVKYVNW
jgi:hypothetical protein